MNRECILKGTMNRFGGEKLLTCLELPPAYMHKPIKDWMCINCALDLVDMRKKKPRVRLFADE